MRRYALAAAAVLLTVGCGSAQTRQTTQRPRFLPIGITFSTADHGWLFLTGSWGKVRTLETKDGGRSWKTSRRSFSPPLPTYDFAANPGFLSPCPAYADALKLVSSWSSSHGYAICGGQPGAGNQRKALYESGDGGKTWRARASYETLPLNGYVRDLRFFDRDRGALLLDRAGIYVTADGGRTWKRSFLAETIFWSWPNKNDGYIAVWDYGVYVSRNSGRSWQRVETQPR